jgi:hypothetical protein
MVGDAYPTAYCSAVRKALKTVIIEEISLRKEQMETQELKALIKESVREVLREERLLLCQVLMPYISDEEQAEIEAEFGFPSDYNDDELIDMTNWVKYGSQISQAGN